MRISVSLISLCVYHTSISGYDDRLCNPVTLAERRERRQVFKPARYLDATAMIILWVKEKKSVVGDMKLPERVD